MKPPHLQKNATDRNTIWQLFEMSLLGSYFKLMESQDFP